MWCGYHAELVVASIGTPMICEVFLALNCGSAGADPAACDVKVEQYGKTALIEHGLC
jgi:hypothetical protein